MQPSRAAAARSSSGSSGAPPLPSSCRAERSNCSTTGWRAKAATSGGATSAWSTRWSCIAWSICSRSKRMSVTRAPPASSPRWSTHCRPMLWKKGASAELPAALRRRERAPHLHEVRHQRAVRELDELGQAGRAAGGQQHRDVMRCGALGGRLAGATGQQVAQLEHLDVVRGCAGGLGERADADDEPRLRASQLVGELVGRVERTGAGDDAAGAQRAVQRERELGEVGEVEREHVAAPEAAAGEAGGDPLHPGRERAVGERCDRSRRRSARADRPAARRGGGRTR